MIAHKPVLKKVAMTPLMQTEMGRMQPISFTFLVTASLVRESHSAAVTSLVPAGAAAMVLLDSDILDRAQICLPFDIKTTMRKRIMATMSVVSSPTSLKKSLSISATVKASRKCSRSTDVCRIQTEDSRHILGRHPGLSYEQHESRRRGDDAEQVGYDAPRNHLPRLVKLYFAITITDRKS